MTAPSIGGGHVRVLVIGGIGSGKSTVTSVFGSLGAVVIEADVVGHAVLEPEGGAFDEVSARWPDAVRDGRIDRAALAGVVFTDTDQLRELEAITHPRIRDEILRRVAEAHPAPVVVELPLMTMELGAGWVCVVVDAEPDERVRRSVVRGMGERDVRARMAAQPDRDEWLARADHILYNGGTLESLEAAARALWDDLVPS